MSVPSGTCVGPYEITAMIGAGGMGEVYRARDSRLDRDVALKLLPLSFALFEFRAGGPLMTPHYSPAPDGQRFLVSALVELHPSAPLAVLVNWHARAGR